MKTNLIFAAAILLAGAGAASANQVQYTFADADGVPYCDGLQLDTNNGLAVGYHTNGSQCTEGDYAGGEQVKLKNTYGKHWNIVTTDPNLPNTTELYVLDSTNMQWLVYDMDTVDGMPFQLVNSGVLIPGNPPAHLGHGTVSGRKPQK